VQEEIERVGKPTGRDRRQALVQRNNDRMGCGRVLREEKAKGPKTKVLNALHVEGWVRDELSKDDHDRGEKYCEKNKGPSVARRVGEKKARKKIQIK